MAGSVKDGQGNWRVLKSGDKVKDGQGIWHSLKNGDMVKDGQGIWHYLGIGPSIKMSVNPETMDFDVLGKFPQHVVITIEGSTQGSSVDTKPAWVTTIPTANDNLRVICGDNSGGNPARYGDIVLQSVEDNAVKAFVSVFQSG